MIRPIRIELRRSNATTVALLLIVIGGLVLATMYGFWRGQWLRFGYAQTTTMFILVPLALAGGAALGRRDRRAHTEDLMNSTGRPGWQRTLPAMSALGIGVAVAHLLVLAVGAILIAVPGSYLGLRGFAAPLIDVLILIGAAWTGVAAGRRWSSALLPPALAAGVLVLQFGAQAVSVDPNRLQNLSLMIIYPPDAPWETVSTPALLGRLALAAGLLLAGVLLAAGRSWPRRAGAGAALAAGVAGLLLITAPGPAGRWQIDPAAHRLVCADGTPQVCVAAVHEHLLPHVTTEARRALAAIAKLPNAPTRAVEVRLDTPGVHDSEQWQRKAPEPGTVHFALNPDPDTGQDPDVADSIAMGGGMWWNGCGANIDDKAMSVVGAWLLGTETVRMWDPVFGDMFASRTEAAVRDGVRALRALPEREQLRRVTAVRDAAARCERELMPILTGEAAS
ncbi:hypothetical protein [Jidongwangia harbinensis]|uniref:hypothetical protein n=1 Tax=Jidongwangia harbinensis TaxID=2878561 RepID=UPI001CD929EB|nr:hypothetical protein [Jidongwangia harbinensis]MCA2212160.1 hypothetical protein [Jidongwangia harbinensis]